MDIHTDTFGGEYPFKGNYVEVNGVRLHYVDECPEGNPKAEPIVMLHGNPTWSFLYRKFIPPLVKAGYRAIAVDHIGYGRSDTPRDRSLYRLKNRIGFFTGVMDHLDLNSITLVMQDWGGPIGLGYAVEHPDRVKRLVIMSTWAFDFPMDIAEKLPQFFFMCRQPILGEGMLLGYNAFVEAFLFAAIIRKERLTDEVMRAYRAPFPDYHSRIATMAIQDVPFEEDHPSRSTMKSIEAKLKSLNVAALLCWGADDELLPSTRMFEMWKQYYPQADTALVPRAGHFLQEDAPDEVIDNILNFMAKYR